MDQAKSPSSRKMTRLVCSMIALEYESNNSQMTNTTNTWIGLFIVHLILEMYHLTALKVFWRFLWFVFSRIRTGYGEIRSIQSECGKTRTRKNPIFGHFSRSVSYEYSEAYQASKMKDFAKIVNGFQQLTIFAKSSILDVWQSSGYASVTKSLPKSYILFIESPIWNCMHCNSGLIFGIIFARTLID